MYEEQAASTFRVEDYFQKYLYNRYGPGIYPSFSNYYKITLYGYYSTLKAEVVSSSETLVAICHSTWLHISAVTAVRTSNLV
jgi:hypothetical protein